MPQKQSSKLLTMEKTGFSYGAHRVFQEVSLSVSKGEMLCLLGPNGCGKTTLIDCIFGINRIETGRIELGGSPVDRLAPKQIARQIAYVPQKHDRHFSFSVLDVLLMGRTPYTPFYTAPDASDTCLAEEILETFGLSALRDRDYTQLSGGETQLVMIMRALVQETPLIIMDEPTAHLDFKNELIVLETIARLIREKKRTLIMATHFPNHAFYFENKNVPVQVAYMDNKKVILSGSPSEALTREKMEHFYDVKTAVITHDEPGYGSIRQIIPIRTLDRPGNGPKK